jgi:hypothetical protein
MWSVAAASAAASAAAAAAAAGPDGIPAGEQVCISYGSWPAEPFLLLWGFVPQPNPADAVVVFSSLQEMAACYFDCLKVKLTAAGDAGQLLQFQPLHEATQQQIEKLETSSGSRFANMTVDATGIDGRLKAAMSVLHGAVAAAAAAAASVLKQQSSSSSSSSSDGQQQQPAEAAGQPTHADLASLVRRLQQLKLGELLVYRLSMLADDLEQSSDTCLATMERMQAKQLHGGGSSLRNQQQQQQQDVGLDAVPHHLQQDDAVCRQQRGHGDSNDSSSSSKYRALAEHLELISGYCSSKAALARQLAAGYPIRMSGVFLV